MTKHNFKYLSLTVTYDKCSTCSVSTAVWLCIFFFMKLGNFSNCMEYIMTAIPSLSPARHTHLPFLLPNRALATRKAI